MNKYLVTFLINGKKAEITLGSYSPSFAYQTAKLLFPKAFIVKATKV